MKKIYTMLFAMLALGALNAQVMVTLNVDMMNETVDPNGVHIAGNFNDIDYDGNAENPDYVNWDPAAHEMTDMGGGLYSITFMLVPGTYEYKFINGNDWPFNETVPSACSVSLENGNRFVVVGEEMVEVDPICYGECAFCGESVVRFRVDMSLVDEDGDGTPGEPGEDIWPDGVSVAGDFQNPYGDEGDWTPGMIWLTDPDGDMIYEANYNVGPMTSIVYKFINGNDWIYPNESVSGDCSDGGGNRLSAVAGSTVFPVVCWSSCGSCVAPTPVTFNVDMSLQTVAVGGVHVAGAFASSGYPQWDPSGIEMLDGDGDGIYSVTLNLQQGDYQYKFVNGNNWDGGDNSNESLPGECSSGGNRVITVGADPMEITYCYNQCSAECVADPDPATVTFQVDMTNTTPSADGVWLISGSTTPQWQAGAIQLSDNDGDMIYTGSFLISGPAAVLYKFINGDVTNSANDEGVPTATTSGIADCALENGLGGYNRTFNRTGVDETLPVVCFNECAPCIVSVEETDFVGNLSIFPVPATDMLTINFNTAVANPVEISLINYLGQVVRVKNLGTVSGSRSIQMDVNGLASGVYALQFSNGTSRVVKTISVK